MNAFFKTIVWTAFLVLWGFAGVLSSQAATSAVAVKTLSAQPAKDPWARRCDKSKKYCEIFQQLSVQEKGGKKAQRLIEFAVGYPPDRKGQSRGVFILPLGVLLNEGTVVSIDGKPAFTFHVRYCDGNGCVAVLDLPAATMDTIRKGKVMTIALTAQNGRKIDINMQLNGLSAALNKIKP